MLRIVAAAVAVLGLSACGDDRAGSPDSAVPLDAVVATDASTEDASASGDPLCPSPSPMEGAACATGDRCQIPGSPCFFVYRCVDGAWDPETVCPPPDECPAELPEDMAPCAAARPLACEFDSCPETLQRAVCEDGSWTVTTEPCPGSG